MKQEKVVEFLLLFWWILENTTNCKGTDEHQMGSLFVFEKT